MHFRKGLLVCFVVVSLLGTALPQKNNDAQSEHQRILQREQWFARGRIIPGENSALLHLHALQQKMQMRSARQVGIRSMLQAEPHGTTAPGAVWIPLGPAPLASDASGTGIENYGTVSGRATTIAIDPADSGGNTVYIGGAYGGVWKSQNAANLDPSQVQWASLTDNLHNAATTGCSGTQSVPESAPTLAIGSIAVQPGNTNPANSVILAGTGEPDNSIDSYFGVGILRFTQGGNAWCLIPQAVSGQSFAGLGFSKIAFSTSNPNLVVASAAATSQGLIEGLENPVAVNRGIYYSNDAGQTWNYAIIQDGATTIAPESVTSVAYNAVAGEFFAVVRNHGFYVSTNGSSWTRLANQPGIGLSAISCPATPISDGCPIYRGEITIVPGRNEMYMWFISLDSAGDEVDEGIWETSNGGNTWTPLDTTSIANCGDLMGCGIGDGAYNLALSAVADGAATDLYAGSVNLYKCEITSLQQNPITCDGSGNQFLNLTHAFGCVPDLGSIEQVHPDQHAIAALVTGGRSLMYFANDGGIYRALDGFTDLTSGSCGQANQFDDLNETLGSFTQFVSFSQSPTDPNTLLGGTQGNGSAAISTATTSTNWISVSAGDGGYSVINPENPSEWFTENIDVSIQRCTNGIGCHSSDFVPVVEPETVGGDHGAFFTPYILDPQSASEELLVGTCRVWRGPTTGGTFTVLSNSFETGAGGCTGNEVNLVRSLATGGTLQNGFSSVIYAGTNGNGPLQTSPVQGGRIWVTTNVAGGPTTWADVTGAINPDGYPISSIAIDSSDASGNTAYVAVMGFHVSHVWKTTNAGTTWIDFSGANTASLPDSPANALAIDQQSKTVYVGTDVGVFSSSTTSPAWSEVGPTSGAGVLPNVAVTALGIFNAGGIKKLRASTYGRGMWEIALIASPDFSLNIPVPSQTIFPGQSASFMASALAFNGYASQISLTCIAGATPTPQTCNIAPSPVIPMVTGAHFTITASDAIGDYSFRVRGVGTDGTTHDVPLTLHVVDFSLNAPTPTFLTVPRGTTSSSSNFSVTSVGSFNGTVNLSCSGLPVGATCMFSPSSVVNPTFNSPANVSLTVTVPLTTAVGNSTITIQATSNGVPAAKTQSFTLNVTLNPDFVLNTNSTFPTVKSGGTTNGTINVTAQDGFTGSVALTCATSQGGSCSILPNTIGTYPTNPTITLNAAGMAGGSSSFTVTGTSSTNTHTLTVPFNVSDYQIVATSVSAAAGQTAISTLTITPVNGYAGNISLVCDTSSLPGASCTFNPASPVSVGSTAVQVGVNIAVPASAQNKAYSIAVNTQDVDGAPQHSTTIPIAIGGDFAIAPVTSSLTIQAGQQAQFAFNVNSVNGVFNSPITFTCAGNPATSACSFSPTSATPANATSVVTMNVATTAPTATLRSPNKLVGLYYAFLFPIGLLFGVGIGPSKKFRKKIPQTIALLLFSLMLGSCGGGGLVGNNSVTAKPGTSSGTYTIAVTGSSGSLSHAAQVTLIIQ